MPPKKKDEKKEDELSKEEVGVFFFPDGSKYDGQFVKKGEAGVVKRHGFGVFTDGRTLYDGQWVEDVMHGEGTITYDSGATYTGTFFQNVFNGRGKYVWPDGSAYEGQWRNNLMNGEGCYTDSTQRRWVGKYYDGKGVQLSLEVC